MLGSYLADPRTNLFFVLGRIFSRPSVMKSSLNLGTSNGSKFFPDLGWRSCPLFFPFAILDCTTGGAAT